MSLIVAMNSQILVSRGKPTTQTSTFLGLSSELGVDGHYDSFIYQNGLFKKNCFHTNFENNPSWTVDLKGQHEVNTVVLYNRMDCCSERVVGTVVEVLSDSNQVLYECGSAKESKGMYIFSCSKNIGSKIRVKNPGWKILHLCEVDVWGCKYNY